MRRPRPLSPSIETLPALQPFLRPSLRPRSSRFVVRTLRFLPCLSSSDFQNSLHRRPLGDLLPLLVLPSVCYYLLANGLQTWSPSRATGAFEGFPSLLDRIACSLPFAFPPSWDLKSHHPLLFWLVILSSYSLVSRSTSLGQLLQTLNWSPRQITTHWRRPVIEWPLLAY